MDTILNHLVEWDHKAETDWQSINNALLDIQNQGHRAYLYKVPDTGGDSIAVIVTNQVFFSQKNIQNLYNDITCTNDDNEEPYFKSRLMDEITEICAEIDDKLGVTIINDDTEDKIGSMPIRLMESIISNKDNTLLVVNIIFSYLDSLE